MARSLLKSSSGTTAINALSAIEHPLAPAAVRSVPSDRTGLRGRIAHWRQRRAHIALRAKEFAHSEAFSRAVTRAMFVFAGLSTLPLIFGLALVHHIYFDRAGVPQLGTFIAFEPPVIGEVKDARGDVLIELAREYRRVVSYDEVPQILRHAVLAAEDKNFFSHSGIEYSALPRVVEKTLIYSLSAWWKGAPGPRVRFPQGGSTLTQQLVRGYFLQHQTGRENGNILISDGWFVKVLSLAIGVPATNKLYRKVEEIRLTLWLEEEMRNVYGSREMAKREIFARYASFIYLGHSRYGFSAASEFYFGKPLNQFTIADASKAALLASIPKSPRDYAPEPNDPRPLRRRNQVLGLMAVNGYITTQFARICQKERLVLAEREPSTTLAPAAIEAVFDELKEHGAEQFNVQDLIDGRISVRTTIDARLQGIVNEALESGLEMYEKRYPAAKGEIQGSAVVLRNSDGAILGEAGGRKVYKDRANRYSDLNRVTGSLRQPGSVWKPLVYLAGIREGLDLSSIVPDEPIAVRMSSNGAVKWIANYDGLFKGPIPLRQALAESRNSVAVWIAQNVGLTKINSLAHGMGVKSPIQPYITSSLGASEMRLLELASVYRAMASGVLAEPHVIERVSNGDGNTLYEPSRMVNDIRTLGLSYEQLMTVQEGLRGVIRLPGGTAHALDSAAFPIPVMGKTGTTSGYRDALFVGSTYGLSGITVAVRVGFDDNRSLGENETGGRTALPIFRDIVLRVYKEKLVGPVPSFPRPVEAGIDAYLAPGSLPSASVTESAVAPVAATVATATTGDTVR